jgi:hypothetical protein
MQPKYKVVKSDAFNLFYLPSIDPLYFKPALSSWTFCSTVSYMPWFPRLHHQTSNQQCPVWPNNAKQSKSIVEQGWMVQVLHPPQKYIPWFPWLGIHQRNTACDVTMESQAKQFQSIVEKGWIVQLIHPPQKFEPQPLQNVLSYGVNKYRMEVPFNGIICLLHFKKIYTSVQKLLGGGGVQTGRLTIW